MSLFKSIAWKKIGYGLILFIVAILFVAPRITVRYLNKNSADLIGRKLNVQKMRINYLTGSVRVYDFKMYELDGETEFVAFDKLYVNLDYWPLLKSELVISAIELDKLTGNVIQEGEKFNFSDFMEGEEAVQEDEQAVPENTEEDGILISLNNIVLSKSNLSYSDLILDHSIRLNDVDLYIPGFVLNSGATNLELDFDFSDGGGFYSKLALDQDQNTFSLNLQLDSLNVDIIEPYIKESMLISDINGYFSNNILINGDLLHLSQLTVSGSNHLESCKVFDAESRKVLSFEELRINIESFDLTSNGLHLSEVALVRPVVLFELVDSSNNWLNMIVETELLTQDTVIAEVNDTISTSSSSTDEGFNYALDKLLLEDGEVLFADKGLDNTFESRLHNISITSKDISALSGIVHFTLSAEINETGRILTDMDIDMANGTDFKVDFSLSKFNMKDIEPYMMHYFGYSVSEGLMNFSSSNTIQHTSMTSNNELYLRKFELDKENKSEARIKLPLRLALGILSDKDGIIDVDLPVESKGEETTIGNLGKIIAKTVGNLFVKAATSPADLLAVFYSYDPNKLRSVEVGMFETLPDTEELETLDVIAQIIHDKPQLRVKMYHFIDKKTFIDSLAYQTVQTDWLMNKHNQSVSMSDSLLKKFIVSERSKLNLDTSLSIQALSRYYCDSAYLSTSYDSIEVQQVDFIKDYLTQQKQVPEELYSIERSNADSVNVKNGHAYFFVEFLSKETFDR